MTGTGISFDEWGAIDQLAARRMARDPELKPLAIRVMFAAIGWSNLIGHAEFAPGGLAMVLQSTDPRTGEMSMPSRYHINDVLRRAKGMGLVHEDSTYRCLIAAEWWEKAGGTGGRSCGFHGIKPRGHRKARTSAKPAKRKARTSAPEGEDFRSKPVTSDNVKPLYESDLPTDMTPSQRSAS